MRIAIPKGRLQDPTLAVFAAAGFDVPTAADLRTRRLVFTRGGIEWIFVKDCDVPVYVEHGAAAAGVAGLDQILEHDCTAYQPVEMPFGQCRMMLIGAPKAPHPISDASSSESLLPRGEGARSADEGNAAGAPPAPHPAYGHPLPAQAGRGLSSSGASESLPRGEGARSADEGPAIPTVVATKYPRIARQYLERRGIRADVIPLGGSVELAAVLGLTSHVIDLVETGETVRVHHLELQDTVAEISPRLIVGRNVYRIENQRIRELIARIEESKNVQTQLA